MVWTAVSYNWSTALTSINSFCSEYYDYDDAAKQFRLQFPGENILALIPGKHEDNSKSYPLLLPKYTMEENND